MADDLPLILVSNRGPVQFGRDDAGERTQQRGGGGLVTALSGLVRLLGEGVWIAAALTDEDVEVSREHGDKAFTITDQLDREYLIRMLEIEPDVQHKFYSIIANPLLWFIQHYLWDLSNVPDITGHERDAFEHGYVPVNDQFADVVAQEVEARGGRAVVMLHDYHFYLVPERVRERCPDVFLHHFVHIPWPQPDAWRTLPSWIRDPLIRGLLGNDVVAFHTERYARNFLLTCQELLDLRVDFGELTVRVGDRTVATRWYPISIDAEAFEALADSPEVRAVEEQLEQQRREFLILRVDRTDLSKNVLRGFKAFDTMLEDHPELAERVTFLALLVPSRQDVDEYIEYMDKVRRLAADVNLKHGTTDWQPIDLRFDDDFTQSMAAYKLFDALVVNPIFDGMNLVAKEGSLVNRRDGVLVLSEHAGVYEELGAFSISVHPFDIQDQADALYRALTMDPEERHARRNACARVVRESDLGKWLRMQLEDIERIRG